MKTPPIQWYPGHIAKAEQQLKRNLDKVDLVIEVRDARIPLATGHPHLDRWLKGKQHLLVINRRDMVTTAAWEAWDQWFKAQGQRTVWCDAKAGTGVKLVQQAAIRAGNQLNERRKNRGMRPRAVRALTLGFPNVGKSALINRLVKKKVVASARRAGVTRTFQRPENRRGDQAKPDQRNPLIRLAHVAPALNCPTACATRRQALSSPTVIRR